MEIIIEKKRTEVLAEGGISFCEVSVALPSPIGEGAGEERVRRFYAALAEGALALGRDRLLPYARERYEHSTDPRRRFTHRPFCLLLTAAAKADGDGVTVTRTLVLTHRGKALFSEEVRERITAEGQILPSRGERARGKRR